LYRCNGILKRRHGDKLLLVNFSVTYSCSVASIAGDLSSVYTTYGAVRRVHQCTVTRAAPYVAVRRRRTLQMLIICYLTQFLAVVTAHNFNMPHISSRALSAIGFESSGSVLSLSGVQFGFSFWGSSDLLIAQ